MEDGSFTILLAEDDEGQARLIERNLRRAGITNPIVHVRDGQEALDFISSHAVHQKQGGSELLAVLDINMPRMDGIEVLRRVKGDPATAKLPVVMLTTTDDPDEVGRCYELGCNVYITKPVGNIAFSEALQRLGLFLKIVKLPSQ